MKHLPHRLLPLQLPFLLPLSLAGCLGRETLPEGPIDPGMPLPPGSLVAVEVASTLPRGLGTGPLTELVRCALEQSVTLDYRVRPAGEATPTGPATARIEVRLGPRPGSTSRYQLVAAIARPSGPVKITCRALVPSNRMADLFPAVDALGRVVRRHLGEKVRAILAANRPVAGACTADQRVLRLLARAREEAGSSRPREAERTLGRALRLDPACGRAMVQLAALLVDRQQKNRALRLLDRFTLAASRATAPDRHRVQRLRLRLLGEWTALLAAGEAWAGERPGDPEGRMSRALALNMLGRYRRALPFWEWLHRHRPDSASRLFGLGLARYGAGDFAGAAQAWDGLAARGAEPLQVLFYGALPQVALGLHDRAWRRLQAGLEKAGGSARLRARIQRMLCALAVLSRAPKRADDHAFQVLAAGRIDPLDTLPDWSLACRYLIFRGRIREVTAFLASLPTENLAVLEPLRLTRIWVAGLVAAGNPGDRRADSAAANLRKYGRIHEACQVAATAAAVRGSRGARLFNLREAVGRNPTPWNRFQLGRAQLVEGELEAGRQRLADLVRKPLALDPTRVADHPLANPLTAVAGLEARRLLDELAAARERG